MQTVDAAPTKSFFINMLTRDIKLEKAIVDLIDNSIDGAKKLRGEGSLEGLQVRLALTPFDFEISDNCGGFDLITAKSYAFVFGRKENPLNEVKHSVGRFGVGMKRALFKMGAVFSVESKMDNDHFRVQVNVDDWSELHDDWTFNYELIEAEDLAARQLVPGTSIKVTELHEDVTQEFSSPAFLARLKDEIEKTLSFFLHKGLSITLNGIKLAAKPLVLLEGDFLKPYFETWEKDGVEVSIYCGIGVPNPDFAGWYIYCNERLVVESDKTILTGWEGRRFGDGVQKYHNIYAMLRGVVFFSSDDSKALPMTTTKTGIDANSTLYRAARAKMIIAMQQVMNFLTTVTSDEERSEIITSNNNVSVIDLASKTYQDTFIFPESADFTKADDGLATIAFKADREMIEKVKRYFRARSNRECGERILDYFVRMESANL